MGFMGRAPKRISRHLSVFPLPSYRQHVRRQALFSSVSSKCNTQLGSTSEAGTASSPAEASKLVDKKVWQRVDNPHRNSIFPWRHETELLPRLLPPNDVLNGLLGPGLPPVPGPVRSLWMIGAARNLNITRFRALFGSAWKQNLADASGWAFSQAVAGVLSNTYRVPFQDIISENGDNVAINFSTVTTDETDEEKMEIVEGNTQDDDSQENAPELEFMMEERLRKLYKASHEFGRDQMQIVLQTEPIACELVSLMTVPFLTREAVKKDHYLRNSYREIFREVMERIVGGYDSDSKSSFELLQNHVTQIIELGRSRTQFQDDVRILESTVIAQVLVTCKEKFSVTDVATGTLVQGNGDTQTVTHLVRLEVVVVKKFERGGKRTTEVGSWQIVDWDDLLGGNLWFW